MKKLLFSLFAVLLLASCSNGKYKISVTFPDESYNGGKAYLTNYDSGDTVDSTVVANKCIEFKGEAAKSFMSRLIVKGERMGFVVEGGDITIIWKDKTAKGTALNEQLNSLNKEFDAIEGEQAKLEEQFKAGKLTEQQVDAKGAEVNKKMIARFHKAYEDNKDNGIGPWAFNYYLMYSEFKSSQIDSVLKTAPADYGKLVRVQKAVKAAKQQEITAVGNKFTDFTVKGEGSKVSRLSDFVGKGKYTLVDFWASWCGPCREEIKNIKKLYAKYNGKMSFVGVAVWDDPADTHAAITELQIPWTVIIGTHQLTEPTDLYGISGIPHIIIFDPKGVIVSRGLQGDALTAEVVKLIGK
jgi:thiol-disulfide isomerase/thioredoxin